MESHYINKKTKHEAANSGEEAATDATKDSANDCERDLDVVVLIVGRPRPSTIYSFEEALQRI